MEFRSKIDRYEKTPGIDTILLQWLYYIITLYQ